MTSEDGDLWPITETETECKNKTQKSCYLPPAGGWLPGKDAPDPVDQNRKDSCMACFRSQFKKQTSDQRLDEATQKSSYPPVGWQFDR